MTFSLLKKHNETCTLLEPRKELLLQVGTLKYFVFNLLSQIAHYFQYILNFEDVKPLFHFAFLGESCQLLATFVNHFKN